MVTNMDVVLVKGEKLVRSMLSEQPSGLKTSPDASVCRQAVNETLESEIKRSFLSTEGQKGRNTVCICVYVCVKRTCEFDCSAFNLQLQRIPLNLCGFTAASSCSLPPTMHWFCPPLSPPPPTSSSFASSSVSVIWMELFSLHCSVLQNKSDIYYIHTVAIHRSSGVKPTDGNGREISSARLHFEEGEGTKGFQSVFQGRESVVFFF